jgi:peptidoglycan/LPS O-acetylase OafA/YrhL
MGVEDRRNTFGALRLLLASMVILAHVPELMDGDRHREPINMLFHNGLTAGSLAVDGFFLISGYLITKSWESEAGPAYFLKRILRIYPAFVVCSLIILFAIGPLVGGEPVHGMQWLRAGWRMAALQGPISDGAFAHLKVPAVDASMWTIPYEFRCYLLTAVLGLLGFYRRPLLLLALVVGLFALTFVPLPTVSDHLAEAVGKPVEDARLTAIFFLGACFRLFKTPLTGWGAALAAVVLVPLMFVSQVAEIAFAVLGGYILFWVALKVRWEPLMRLNAKNDISYGVYLWAWPLSAMVLTYWPSISLPGLLVADFVLSALAGAISWFVIEKPAMSMRGKLGVGRRPALTTAG